MNTREEQKEKRRKEILEGALDLFIRKGYSAAKISDIARQVGMSAGLMFHYFDSKEKLYEELIRYGISGPMNTMDTMAPTQKEPLDFFEDTAAQIFHFIRTEPFVAKMFVLMSQAFYNEAAPEGVKEMLRGFDIYTPTAALMRKGQQNGTIREGDPNALALAYWCSIQGIAEQMALRPGFPCPETGWVLDMIRRKEQ